MKNNKNIYWALSSIFICTILYLIWPTAHTIALRKLLLVLSAFVGLILWHRSEDRYVILKSPWLIFLGLLLAWVIFHAAFISRNGNEAWREFSGQWFPAYVAVFAGIGLALAGRSINTHVFKIYLLAVLATQPTIILITSIYNSIQIGHLDIGFKIGFLWTDLKPSLTFSSDMFAALACAKFLDSFELDRHSAKKYVWLLPIALAMSVAIFTETKNSILLLSLCIMIMLVVLGFKLKFKQSLGLFAGAALIVAIAIYAMRTVPTLSHQWDSLASDIKVAVNVDEQNNWIDFYKLGLPKNDLGEEVSETVYLRIAYQKIGLRTILENPWGYGVTRKAFERLVQQKYPEASIANAHNGYINLASAVGFPGLILFVLVIISIYRQLYQSGSEWAHPAAWIIGIYVIHWMIDPIERDHFFQSYLFVIALLLTLTLNNTSQKIDE